LIILGTHTTSPLQELYKLAMSNKSYSDVYKRDTN